MSLGSELSPTIHQNLRNLRKLPVRVCHLPFAICHFRLRLGRAVLLSVNILAARADFLCTCASAICYWLSAILGCGPAALRSLR
jgi:hypothetical protein